MKEINVVIAKPTRECNADCSYCSSPPDGISAWTLDTFKKFIDTLEPNLNDGMSWIWHGGEPMLMGVQFFYDCKQYTDSKNLKINYSMQTNLIAYKTKVWKKCFNEVFEGRISSSYEPGDKHRSINQNTEKFAKNFWRAIKDVTNDGFRPLVIGTYTEENKHLGIELYEKMRTWGNKAFSLRYNYCNISGRYSGQTEPITPISYGNMLIEVYNKWIQDTPDFTITPHDQMFLKMVEDKNEMVGRCPWTRRCGGQFINIDPNGDIYNCSDFADLGDPAFKFGNLHQDNYETLMSSKGAKMIKQRRHKTPPDCQTCEHYFECEGGCARDSILYQHGIHGKFHYCLSWKMIFTRIKESILTGEADKMIIKFGYDPIEVKAKIQTRIMNHFMVSDSELMNFEKSLSPFGFFDNFNDQQAKQNVKNVIEKKYYSAGYNSKRIINIASV